MKLCNTNDKDATIKNLLNDTLKDIMSVINAECGSLFIFDSKNKELVLDQFYNSGNFSIKGLKQGMGEGISGKVADIKTPILVKDITRDSRFRRNGFKHYRTNSFISVPLIASGELLGLINLADKSSGEPFSEKDLECAVAISKCACLVVDTFYNLDKQKLHLEQYASVGKLAAGIVHEINNPLDGVIRYTNILLEQMENNSNSTAKEYLLEVKRGLNRIANITRSLLEFSHQVNFHPKQVKKYIDMHGLIDESLSLLRYKLNGNIQIDKRYKDNLPKILDLGLSHVVINIIKNALDAMPGGGTLAISTDIDDSVVEISFEDTGSGIPLDIRNRIFEPFFTTKAIDKGTGLGLAICNEIITKYDGRIEVDTSCGQGSTFTIVIPKKYLENA